MPHDGEKAPPPPVRLKWLSTVISALILGAFVVFYILHDRRTTQLSIERDLRILSIASDALRQSLGAKGTAKRDVEKCDGLSVGLKGSPTEPEKSPSNDSSEVAPENTFCISFEAILRFVPRAQQVFDKTLLVDEKGKVLKQAGRPEVPHFGSIESLKLYSDGKATNDRLKPAEPDPISEVHFGDGKRYRLFCQSTVGATADTAPLSLCGLASEERLHSRWLLPQPLLVVLCVALVLTVLLPPFLRMRLLSPTQRFRFTDAFALNVCMLFGLVLLTLAARGIVTQLRLESVIDDQLEELAGSMSHDLEDELNAANEQLNDVDVVNEPFGVRNPEPGEWAAYPNAENVSWADLNGFVKWKITQLDLKSQSRVNVLQRTYFQRARVREETVIDSVRSYTNGETRLIVARRKDRGPDQPGVLILNVPVLSLSRPVLPDGLGFALVDRLGNVLFHSDPSLSNSHSVLTECEDDGALQRFLERGPEDGNEGRPIERLSYFGVDHRAFVKTVPIPWSPSSNLTLIVFEETAKLRGVMLETMTDAVVSSIIYASIWLAVGLACVLAAGRLRLFWLWPEARRRGAYVGLFFWFVAVIAVAFDVLPKVLDRTASPNEPGTLGIVEIFAWSTPFLVVLSALLVFSLGRLTRGPRPSERRLELALGRGGYWRAYCLMATAFWLVCAVIPPYVFASRAMDGAAQRFAEHRAASFEARAQTSLAAPNLEPVGVGYEPPGVRAYESVLHLSDDQPEPFAQRVLQALHPQERPQKGDAEKLWVAWLISVVFTLGVGPLVFWVVRWFSETVLLRSVDKPLDSASLEPNASDLWCVVASRRTLETLSTSDGSGEGQYAIVGAWFGSRPDGDLLAMLEAHADRRASRLIVSNRTPIEALRSLEAEKDLEPGLVLRWTALLRDFRVAFVRDARSSLEDRSTLARELMEGAPRSSRRATRWLTRELQPSKYVVEACRASLPPGSLSRVERIEGLRRVRDAAWHYYLEIWNACSHLEQLTLVQLAEEGFINAKRREVVRTLLSRGILCRRPMLAPFNDSFAAFVRIQGGELRVRTWEAPPQGLSWAHLRAPLFVVFACTAYILFFTERTLFDSTLLFATTLTALVPHLGRLASATVPSLQRIVSAPDPAPSPTETA